MMTSADFENSAADNKMQNDDEDPVETMIKKTGCVDFHFKVQVEILGQLTTIQPILLPCVVGLAIGMILSSVCPYIFPSVLSLSDAVHCG